MSLFDRIIYQYFRYRQKNVDAVIARPFQYQKDILDRAIRDNRTTLFGKGHDFSKIKNIDDYKHAVPIRPYEEIYPFIKQSLEGAKGILTNEKVAWFAKSSGTSNDRSKYIPVTHSYLQKGHLKCAWDAASFIYNEDPTAKLFADKSLIMAGALEETEGGFTAGDISAIIIHNFPSIGRRFYVPDFKTALLSNWELKIERIAHICQTERVTLLAGVPTWTIVLLKRILELSGKKNISEIWPNLRSYLHGGVGFEPYKNVFKNLIPSQKCKFREVYNASEGYFAIQNNSKEEGMMLLCDHEIFYEFIPKENVHDPNPETISLKDVELSKTYALVITTTSGLYRYLIGDLVKFVSISPYKIKVVGRIHEYLNVFGEELSVLNVEKALEYTCDMLGVDVCNYTIAPHYLNAHQKGGHHWLIAFNHVPLDIEKFAHVLDNALRENNSDYDAKRTGDLALTRLKITQVSPSIFDAWLKKKNKYGGQNKIPRMRNDRTIFDSILDLTN